MDPNVGGIPPKQEAKDEVIEFDPTFGECAPLRKKNCKKKKKEGRVKHILLENETKPKKRKKEGRIKHSLLGIKQR
jgi:hypothetical protein